jgi:hypothetical protein
MTKTRRNNPCPCGSGKKYKHCCLKKDEAAEHEALAAISQATQERGGSRPRFADLVKIADRLAAQYEDDVELTNASNAAVDLVRAGKLDEAEQAARELLVRFPDVHDGTRPAGTTNKPPTTIGKPSTSFASIRTSTTIRNWKPSSTGSSTSSIHQPPSVDPIV